MRSRAAVPRALAAGTLLLLELPLLLPVIVGAIVMAIVVRVGALTHRPRHGANG